MKPLDEIVLPSKLGHVDQQQTRVNFHDCHDQIKSPLNRWRYAFELRTIWWSNSLPSPPPPSLSDYHRSTILPFRLSFSILPPTRRNTRAVLIRLLIREISLITPPSPQRKQTRLVISVAASLVINLCPCKGWRWNERNTGIREEIQNDSGRKEGSATREWQEEEGKKMEEDGGGRP